MKTKLNSPTDRATYEAYLESEFCPESPLDFATWQTATRRLDYLLNCDPDGYDRSIDREIKELSGQLGV